MEKQSKTCMFMGYAEIHNGNVYGKLNFEIKKIAFSRGICWLEKLRGGYDNVSETTKILIYEDSDIEEDNTNNSNDEEIAKNDETIIRATSDRQQRKL